MAIDFMPTLGADGRMGNIDPEALKQILALRQTGHWTGANAGGNLNATQQWYDPNVVGNNGWRLQYQPGVDFNYEQGTDARPTLNPSRDMRAITKIREDTGGKLGDWWNEDGTYGGTFEAQDGGGRQFNTAALMFGAALGGNLAMSNTSTGGLSGLDAAALDAGAGATNVSGGSLANVGSGAFVGEGVASGVPAWDAAAIKSAISSGELATAGSYGLQTLEGGTALETAGQLVNPTRTAANQAAQQAARQGGNNSPSNLNGWEQLARIGGGALAAGVAGNALADPVDTSRFDSLFDNILKEQQTASQRGADLWENYQSTWRPLEQKFAESALNFDTPQRREDYAQRAGLAVADNYAQQRQEAERDMMAAGLDPSTMASLGAASRAWEAKDRAGASNDARLKVEMAGLDLLSGGANFARTMSNAATDQSRVATGNTQAASGILNQQAGLQNQNTANRNALIGDLFGAGMTSWGMYKSSKKTKKVGGKVDGLAAADAVEKSPAKKWAYKPGQGDGSAAQRMGPMAEDLKREAPGVSDGKQVDAISQLGLHHAAIGNLNKRIRKLEKQADGVYAEA